MQTQEPMPKIKKLVDNLTPEQTDQLRQMIQAGIDSGPARPVDFEEIKRRGRQRISA